jgi:hypothetical protein
MAMDSPIALNEVIPKSPSRKIGCSKDAEGFRFQIARGNFVVGKDNLVVAFSQTWKEPDRHAIPLHSILRIDRVRLDRDGQAWSGIEVVHGSEKTTLPVRHIAESEIDWLIHELRRCIAYRLQHSEDSETQVTSSPVPALDIHEEENQTTVRFISREGACEITTNAGQLSSRTFGWCEPQVHTFGKDLIFDLRFKHAVGPEGGILLLLADGRQFSLGNKHTNLELQRAVDALRKHLWIKPQSERSAQNLLQAIDAPADDGPHDAGPKTRTLSYARTPIDAPQVTQVEGSFTIFFPALRFWRGWMLGFLAVLPAFIMVESWFSIGYLGRGTRGLHPAIIAVQLLVCVVAFVLIAVATLDRTVRLIVSNGELRREMKSRFLKLTNRWPVNDIKDLEVSGLTLQLHLKPKPPPARPQRLSPFGLARCPSQTELIRATAMLRIAVGLDPAKGLRKNTARA